MRIPAISDERAALRFGELVEDRLKIRHEQAAAVGGAQFDPRAEARLGHRHLDAFDLGDQLGELRLGLHQRSCRLDHWGRFHPHRGVPPHFGRLGESVQGASVRASDINPAQVWSMSDARDKERSRRAWELAQRQHGVIARRQLLSLGFNAREIEHRVARGRLHTVMRGVYAVGWPRLTLKRRWMAGVLACGEEAVLSHRSAAALWGIGTERSGEIDVSVCRRTRLRRPGIRVRSRSSLGQGDMTRLNGIPVTGIVRTLVDMAAELSPRAVERR